ncbi:MAG TPA: ABC transporter substrate-binding protein [Methylomirabilota bacterium]
MRLWHRWVAAIAIGAVGLAVWAGAGRAQAPKAQWVVAIGEEGESLDPPTSMLFTSEIYQQHLFDCLLGIEGEEFKPVPLLAEKWETVNPTTWRFHLRKGVKFHNGKPLTAEDVKYSFEQYADPKNRRSVFARGISRIEIKNASTVDLITSEPVSALLFNLTRLQIVPKETREKEGVAAFAAAPVGTGPYKFGEWKRDQQLVLEANPTYWRGQVNPKRLIFRAIRDASTRAAELRSGGVDIIATPPAPQLEMIDSGDTQVTPVKGGRIIIYPFNVSAAPFNDRRVREAANLAVNKEAIVKNVLGGRGIVMAGPFTPAWLGYDPSVKPFPYDPAKAKALLAEAGYPQGFDTTWSISSGVFLKDTEIAEAVAGQLRAVGIRAKIVPTERAKIQKDAQENNFQGMTSVAWGTQFEPDVMLNWVMMRDHMTVPRIKELIVAGRAEVDLEKRRKIYQELYRTAHDEALWLFVHAQDELWAKRRDIPWTPYSITGSKAIVYYFQVPGGR